MKIKTVLTAFVFLSLGYVMQAQKYPMDATIDGFKGLIKSCHTTTYEALVQNDKMVHGPVMEVLTSNYGRNGYRKTMEFLGTKDSVLFRSRYKHDGFGLTTLEQIVAPDESIIGRTYYLYNANNVLTEWYVEDAERQVENRVLIHYDAQGRVDKRSYNDAFNEIFKRENYTYGPDGNIQKTVVFDITGTKVQEWRYEYDEHNMPVSQTLYDYSESAVEPEVSFVVYKYKYDQHGNWIQKVEY
ncbi:MAG: hypothetical protein SPJ13_06950, partial [Bacteroidales bacterium]|nr:hypothetical protein [Bacteroidales bacterium]